MTDLRILILLLIAPLAVTQRGCTLGQKLSTENIAFVYRTRSTLIHPSFQVHHLSHDSSRLYFSIRGKELMPVIEPGAKPKVSFRVSFRLLADAESNQLLDSVTAVFSDSGSQAINQEIISAMDFRMKRGTKALLELKITDLNRNTSSRFFVHTDKRSYQSRENFLISPEDRSGPLFTSYIPENVPFRLQHDSLHDRPLIVRWYNRNFPLPPPPFSVDATAMFNYRADSLFIINIQDADLDKKLPGPGFYHIQTDSAERHGLTIFRFGREFPGITSPEKMIEPLRYLTTRKEFEELSSNPNKKEAIDKFWLQTGGNTDRSKELIRRFYNRVLEANRFFSSYIEGWKTDRGMIFVVFGPPNMVYRSNENETWSYGDAGNMNSLNFNFTKVENPFSNNDYVLNRSNVYDAAWFRGVDLWRQGRIFND